MEATSFDESNHVLGAPKGMTAEECSPLSVFMHTTRPDRQTEIVISCWKLTTEELDEINRTGRVWLFVWGQTMPPVLLQTKSPFAG
jgi:hypothetical protein